MSYQPVLEYYIKGIIGHHSTVFCQTSKARHISEFLQPQRIHYFIMKQSHAKCIFKIPTVPMKRSNRPRRSSTLIKRKKIVVVKTFQVPPAPVKRKGHRKNSATLLACKKNLLEQLMFCSPTSTKLLARQPVAPMKKASTGQSAREMAAPRKKLRFN